MAEAKLQRAKTLIESRQYDDARAILRTLPDDPTAQRWLAKLDQISSSTANPEHDAILKQAKTLISDKKWAEARALLTPIKSNPTAQRWLAKLDEIAPVSAASAPSPTTTSETANPSSVKTTSETPKTQSIKATSEAPKSPKAKTGASPTGQLPWPILAGAGLIVIVLIIGVGAVAMSSSRAPTPSTPAGAAQEFIKALVVEQDQAHLLALTCNTSKSSINLFSSMVSSSLQRNNVTNVDISGLTYTVTSQTETTALVNVGGSMHYTMQGTPQDETFAHFSGNDSGIALLLENGQWHYCLEAANSVESTIAPTQPANADTSNAAPTDDRANGGLTPTADAQTGQNTYLDGVYASRTAVAAQDQIVFSTLTAERATTQQSQTGIAPAGTQIPSFHLTLTSEVGQSLTSQAGNINSVEATYTAIAIESEIIYMTLTAQAKSR